MSERIAIASLRLDGGTQPRGEINEQTLDEYAEAMEAGVAFPAVIVFHDGDVHWLADGFHRVRAAMKIGRKNVTAEVRQGTREDAVWFSCGANQAHGLRRSNPDKRRAVETALRLRPAESDRAIAEHCGVSHNFVGDVRRSGAPQVSSDDTSKRTGRDGKQYPAKASGGVGARALHEAEAHRRDQVRVVRDRVDEPDADEVGGGAQDIDSRQLKPSEQRCPACAKVVGAHQIHCASCGEHTMSSKSLCEHCGGDPRGEPVEAETKAPAASPLAIIAPFADAVTLRLRRLHALGMEMAREWDAMLADLGQLKKAGKLPPGEVLAPLATQGCLDAQHLREVAANYRRALPEGACAYCRGTDPSCSGCKGRWWMTKDELAQVPADIAERAAS